MTSKVGAASANQMQRDWYKSIIFVVSDTSDTPLCDVVSSHKGIRKLNCDNIVSQILCFTCLHTYTYTGVIKNLHFIRYFNDLRCHLHVDERYKLEEKMSVLLNI